jgi:hypothetical protein
MRAVLPWAIYSLGEKCFVFSGDTWLQAHSADANVCSEAQNGCWFGRNQSAVRLDIFLLLRRKMWGYVLQLSSGLRFEM